MKLFFIFICISVLTLPSLCITFSARPTWGDDEQGVGVLKKFSIGAMVRPSSTDAFGCDEDYCTFPTAKSRDSHGAIFVPPVPCRSFQTAEVCTVAEGCDFVASCGGCVNVGSNCVSTASLLALIVWLDLICCLAFVASVCVCMCVYVCMYIYTCTTFEDTDIHEHTAGLARTEAAPGSRYRQRSRPTAPRQRWLPRRRHPPRSP